MPNVPRGDKGFQETIKCILNTLKNKTPINSRIKINNTLEQLYIRLRPSGFVSKKLDGSFLQKLINFWNQACT